MYPPYAGAEPSGIKKHTHNLHSVDTYPQIQIEEEWTDSNGNEVTGTFEDGKTYTYKATIKSVVGPGAQADANAPDIRTYWLSVYNWATRNDDIEEPIFDDEKLNLSKDSKQVGKNYISTYTIDFVAKAPESRDLGTYVMDIRDGSTRLELNPDMDKALCNTFDYLYHYWNVDEPTEYSGVVCDIDNDGSYDIGIVEDDSGMGDEYQVEELTTTNIKTSHTTEMQKEYQEFLDYTNSEYYSKVTVLFGNPTDISKTSISGITNKGYTGKDITQSPVIKDGSTTLKQGTDYTLSYKNNKKIGTATVTIKGIGNYTGSVNKTFKIGKGTNPLSVSGKTATVKYSKVKKKAQTLAVSKVITTSKKGAGTVTYTKSSGNKKITINKKTGKVTVKKGLKKGTYKVKIKVKAAGNTNYKAATKDVSTTIKVK